MRVGTKSLLYGAHCFFLHPWFVLAAWWKLYGFPWDPRIWVAAIVHDWGLWGKRDLDGTHGTSHPEFGARICGYLFGKEWRDFCLYHSRYYAKQNHQPPSRLCFADKLSTTLEPRWLYLPRVRATGEIEEYLLHIPEMFNQPLTMKEESWYQCALETHDDEIWFKAMCSFSMRWVKVHYHGGEDDWTAVRVNGDWVPVPSTSHRRPRA